MWSHAFAVVAQVWMTTSVWFTMKAACHPYRWYFVARLRVTIIPVRSRTSSLKAHAGCCTLLGSPVRNNIKILVLGSSSSWGRSFFVGSTTTRDPAVVAALYLGAHKSHEEGGEMLHGCMLAADNITFRQAAVRERFALPIPALKTCDPVVLSFTMCVKTLQLRIGNDRPVVMSYDGPPPVLNYTVVVCEPGSVCQLPRVDPFLCDRF